MAKRKKPPESPGLFDTFSPSQLADRIDEFLAARHTAADYKIFIVSLFNNELKTSEEDPVWDMVGYLENESDYFTAPASTRFHGARECGLVVHSLAVLAKCLRLYPAMLQDEPDLYYMVIACLFHDLCKVNMYETKSRNVKNEKTGVWEQVPCYITRGDYLSFGHGVESMLRLNKFIKMPAAWNHAIRWHMGAYDNSPSDEFSYKKALSVYHEVLLLHTADMLAGVVDGV